MYKSHTVTANISRVPTKEQIDMDYLLTVQKSHIVVIYSHFAKTP